MAEMLATMAIWPLVSLLMNKSSSYLLDKYKVMEGMEEQHKVLKHKLPAILDVIADAEEQATAHREGVKAWLQELKAVAYKANEVFDEFNYEALCREAKKNGHYRKLGFDVIKLLPTHNSVVFRHTMGRKLHKILQAIEALIADMQAFGFKDQPQPPVSKEWRQTDYVIIDPQEIASTSRHKEKKKIVDILLGQASSADLAVVPIVGMGGLGKTTLAQLIYNDTEVQKHFQLLLWVCVSDNFDVNSVAKSIVEASPKRNYDRDKPPLDRLQRLVSGQRYLLVLDDVWNNREFHKWDRLKVCLQQGGAGSAVLTTTRDKRVAEIMGANTTHNLTVLDDSFIKEIIEAKAFAVDKEKPADLVEMVDEIVKRCSGSPLAATALGSVLRSKASLEEWKAISSRSSICTEETGIMPIVKLSYNDLPSHMKQCFAYCALFPKDFKIDVDKLIQLWIANGFIPEHKEYSPETIGSHIFNELASRSFFLDIEESEDYHGYFKRTCKIHDLMHVIAMDVMEKECVAASFAEENTEKPSQPEWLPDTVRHLYLSCEDEEAEGILNDAMERGSPAIQTLLCYGLMGRQLQHLSKYKALHALKICTLRKSFPLKPKYLHQLRFLDLSNTNIRALLEDISILYNLQVLDLSDCSHLHRLPRQMKYMTSLRHLYTHGCPDLKNMPPELGKLTMLQTLTCFVAAVTDPGCSDVVELEHLNLVGQLEVRQMENIDKEAEAKVAMLGKKKNLRKLRLRWTSVCDSEVLNNFEPHDGLQVLRIYSYGGKCMGMLQNMVEIHLFRCERLQVLFRCGTSFTFPKLKQLTLEHLLDFETWSEINEERMTFPLLEKLFILYCKKVVALPGAPLLPEGVVRSAFPSLKVLNMVDLKSFQRWDATVEGVEILFPLLEELSIEECPELISLPESPVLQEPCSGSYRSAFPALKVLKLKKLASFQRWDAVEGTQAEHISFPQLEKLSIKECPELIDLPEAPKLSVLEIEKGKQEVGHWAPRYLSSLTTLRLDLENAETTSDVDLNLIELVGSKEKSNQKSPLTYMKLVCCNSFFESGALEPWDYFVHLENLVIKECVVLVHWPEEVFQNLVSLRSLEVSNCKNLTGYTQAPLEPSTSQRSQHLPGLVSLCVRFCPRLVEMFNVPESLKSMYISCCDKLESIFSRQQQGRSELAQGASCNEVIMPTAVSELSSLPMNHLCPCLETLFLLRCDSLPVVLHLPPSLKTIDISYCSSIQVLSCQQDGPPKPQVTNSINASEPSAADARQHSLPPCLKSLTIWGCSGMLGGTLRLPTSLTELEININRWLTSLEVLSGEPPSLEDLSLQDCSALASLPPQAYGSLWRLRINECPAIKKLPRCLQQQLGSIEVKHLDDRYEVVEFKPFKPKTWKEIPRLVREWRQTDGN